MGRLIAVDFGRKRCGIAATDTLRLVANPLTTVRACDLVDFIAKYVATEEVDQIVVGLPKQLNGQPSESQRWLMPAVKQLRRAVPDIPVVFYDERFTSVLAHRAMIDGGVKKMDRRDKALVDQVSASIILNDYLESIRQQGGL